MSAERSLPWTPVKIGWISGVSQLGTRSLSPEQRGFIQSLPGDPAWKLATNFPYGGPYPDADYRYKLTPLPIASLVNLTHFLLASQPIRRPSRSRAWRELRASCDLLLLVTNSCGAQIVQALERGSQPGSKLRTFSLGSVDWGASRLERVTLRGSLDKVGLPGRSPDDITVEGIGHMDYARSNEVRRIAGEWVRKELRQEGLGGA